MVRGDIFNSFAIFLIDLLLLRLIFSFTLSIRSGVLELRGNTDPGLSVIEDISSNRSIVRLFNIQLISNFFPGLKISGGTKSFLLRSIMNFIFNSANIAQCILKTFLKKN